MFQIQLIILGFTVCLMVVLHEYNDYKLSIILVAVYPFLLYKFSLIIFYNVIFFIYSVNFTLVTPDATHNITCKVGENIYDIIMDKKIDTDGFGLYPYHMIHI